MISARWVFLALPTPLSYTPDPAKKEQEDYNDKNKVISVEDPNSMYMYMYVYMDMYM